MILILVYDKYSNSNLAKHAKIGIETYIAPLKGCKTTHSVVFDTFNKLSWEYNATLLCKFILSTALHNPFLYDESLKLWNEKGRCTEVDIQSLHSNLEEQKFLAIVSALILHCQYRMLKDTDLRHFWASGASKYRCFYPLSEEYWSRKHETALKSGCWGGYHNKPANRHFLGHA